ncbi:hypothetical protein BLS_003975 [Venturia inaequalis]|uniref:SRR1-like domain-containing protein n=1 Tax=Venturia inaequalis TaxID=5025 RepID=A0A8H3VER5_VENIN|nr:hypothetical protein BLS_003975 [Venturia inaequalis]KAE9987410.1 hypothetical protein EG328_002766 [Venturia inaequalis]KAE9994321.1 hypothetical protein EG327_011423 [Venturia inaequalis]RDI87009.1 hypothetical protein Vi05172_g3243 [Venturia inaequalis]
MPSKTRSKNAQHVKRKTVELSDGWSVITSSKSKPLTAHTTNPHLDPDADYSPPTPERVTTVVAEVNTYLERWRHSQCATGLPNILRRRKAKDGGVVDNAICAGLGSLNTESLAQKRTRMWQFVVFLWLIDEVRDRESGKDGRGAFMCYAQEPRFTPTDVEVLKHFGILVLPALNGEEFINEKTLLYAPFLPWSLLLKDFLHAGTPAICVSNDVGESVEMLQMRMKHGTKSLDSEGLSLQEEDLKECERVGRTFLEKRKGVAFPAFEFHAECLKLMVYIEEEETEVDVEKG